PGSGHRNLGVQGLPRRLRRSRSRAIGGAVGDPHGDRDRPHRRAVSLCRAQGSLLMVERQPGLTLLTHAVLVVGIAVVACPIYVPFVASTHTLDDVVRAPMPLAPGRRLVDNYGAVLAHGLRSAGGAPVGRMMANSLVMAGAIAVGKIVISLLSAF